MRTTDTVIIGAGQAGLAASRCLTDHGHDHVVLERGRIGQRWRSGTWDSLHLLTPNWLNALPGRPYRGPDPGRLRLGRRVHRPPRRLRAVVRRTRRGARRRSPAAQAKRSVRDHHRRRGVAGRRRHHRHRLVRPAGHPGDGPGTGRRHPPGRAERVPQPALAAAGRCPGRRRVGDRRPARRRARRGRTRRDDRRRQPHPDAAHATAAWTSTGGSSASGISTGRSTRCPTVRWPAASRPPSWSAHPTAARSTWPPCRPPASAWSAG